MSIFKVGDLIRFKADFGGNGIYPDNIGIILNMTFTRFPEWYGMKVLVDDKEWWVGSNHVEVISDETRAT